MKTQKKNNPIEGQEARVLERAWGAGRTRLRRGKNARDKSQLIGLNFAHNQLTRETWFFQTV